VTQNTDGEAVAEQAASETPTEQQATTPAADSAGRSAEDRIAGLVAERERLKVQLDKEKTDRAALEDKHKSDEDKRFDERVAGEVKPLEQRLEHFEADYTVRRDKLLATLPEDARDCYDSNAPVETQLRQVEIVADSLSKATPASAVDSGGNPGGATETKWTLEDYNRVSALATSVNPADREVYDKEWPQIRTAIEKRQLVIPRAKL
jgi:hypothetical protein